MDRPNVQPFAKAAAAIEPQIEDDEPVVKEDKLVVGDLRRAARLLAETQREEQA